MPRPERHAAPVAIATGVAAYPSAFPFEPDTAYPEYGARPIAVQPNPVYRAVRQLFTDLGFDRGRFDTKDWNPLAHVVFPGDRVFIKPNLVTHEYRRSAGRDGDLFSVITHPSVVRAVADYVALALRGQGEIVIGDNPSIDADFERLMRKTELDRLPELYATRYGTRCRVLDLRPLRCEALEDYGYRSRMKPRAGDPEGSIRLDLGSDSLFHGLDSARFRGVFSDRRETISSHSDGRHEYEISKTIFGSDVYISIPKLKAHHKVGATLNVKGLVGINANKNHLVHWRIGTPEHGGDEFPGAPRRSDRAVLALRHAMNDRMPESLQHYLKSRLAKTRASILFAETRLPSFTLHRGAWQGNDTCWRMAADLYNVFIRDLPRARRAPLRTFCLVDGVIGGDGDGPFMPNARQSGVLLGSENLLAADVAAIRYMDFDVSRVRYAVELMGSEGLRAERIPVRLDGRDLPDFFANTRRYASFATPSHWPDLGLGPIGTSRFSSRGAEP